MRASGSFVRLVVSLVCPLCVSLSARETQLTHVQKQYRSILAKGGRSFVGFFLRFPSLFLSLFVSSLFLSLAPCVQETPRAFAREIFPYSWKETWHRKNQAEGQGAPRPTLARARKLNAKERENETKWKRKQQRQRSLPCTLLFVIFVLLFRTLRILFSCQKKHILHRHTPRLEQQSLYSSLYSTQCPSLKLETRTAKYVLQNGLPFTNVRSSLLYLNFQLSKFRGSLFWKIKWRIACQARVKNKIYCIATTIVMFFVELYAVSRFPARTSTWKYCKTYLFLTSFL